MNNNKLRYLLENTEYTQRYLFSNGYCWDSSNNDTSIKNLDDKYLIVFHPDFSHHKPDELRRVQACDMKFYEFDKQNLVSISLSELKTKDKPERKSWWSFMNIFNYNYFGKKR